MKRILVTVATFVLGLVIGSGATGVFVKKFYENQNARMYSFDVAEKAMLAGQLRAGLSQIILESADRQIVQGVLFLHQNEEFKDMMGTATSYSAAKEYYVCAKMDFPPEIAQIMNELPPVPESKCSGEE
ncbi:MAG: hypothetical protein ABL984_09395 [Pyrinomonadaceae bacterium]